MIDRQPPTITLTLSAANSSVSALGTLLGAD
jgi:hypothetical protein